MLAAILTICGTCVMTSCSNDDDTVVENPLENKLEGVWYTAYEASGSLENPNGDGVIQYTHAVETYRFSHEGANVWNRYFFFGENDEPITDLGGGSNGLGAFSYTSKDDGTITVTLTNTSQAQEKNRDDYAPLTRTLRLADDKLLTKGLGDKDVVFERDTVELATLFGQWNVMLHGGSGSTTNPKELDVDVDDVKYTILNDETTGLGSTLWKVVHSPKKSLMIQTAVKEMEDRGLVILPAEAKTRATGAVTAGPTGYPASTTPMRASTSKASLSPFLPVPFGVATRFLTISSKSVLNSFCWHRTIPSAMALSVPPAVAPSRT